MRPLLWEQTRDLHHACEAHEVGSAMATGEPPKQWYANWVNALLAIHSHIDKYYSESIHRAERLKKDLESLIKPNNLSATDDYVLKLNDEKSIAGAAYVLTGAHLMGGEVMRRRLKNYPTAHLEWDDRKAALKELEKLRQREDVVEEARMCFAALLQIMDEIRGK